MIFLQSVEYLSGKSCSEDTCFGGSMTNAIFKVLARHSSLVVDCLYIHSRLEEYERICGYVQSTSHFLVCSLLKYIVALTALIQADMRQQQFQQVGLCRPRKNADSIKSAHDT